MKKFLFLMSIPWVAFGWSRRVDMTAGNVIPTSYDRTNANSLILSEYILPESGAKVGTLGSTILFITTAHEVMCNWTTKGSLENPADTDKRDIYLVASEPIQIKADGVNAVFCKSAGAATVKSGWLSVATW